MLFINKSIFTTRFKECCKEKGYTQQDIADKLNISINGLKHHLRNKNPNFPPLDLLGEIANILDVDIGYLIGEIDCKRYSMQKISDITGLYKTVLPYIVKKSGDYSWEFCRLFDILSETPYIDDLLKAIDDYLNLSTTEVISVNFEHKKSYASTLDASELLRAKAITIFDKILSDTQQYSFPFFNGKISDELARNLLLMIDENKEKYKNDYEPLYEKVEYYLSEINKIDASGYISMYSAKQIVHDKNQRLKEIYLK